MDDVLGDINIVYPTANTDRDEDMADVADMAGIASRVVQKQEKKKADKDEKSTMEKKEKKEKRKRKLGAIDGVIDAKSKTKVKKEGKHKKVKA